MPDPGIPSAVGASPVIHLVNYSDDAYRAARLRQNQRAREFGIGSITSWTRTDLEQTPFYRIHRGVLDQERGGGYWLWKPFIIHHALMRVPDGDAVVYADSGLDIVAPLAPLVAAASGNGGFFLTWQRNRNRAYTKRDCFVLMGCDEDRHHDASQCDASFQIYVRNPATIAFVRDYLHACADPAVLTDGEAVCGLPELEGFRDHRHDQSVLSLLCLRHGIRRFPQVSQYRREDDPADAGDHRETIPGGPYLHHHRARGGSDQPEPTDARALLDESSRAPGAPPSASSRRITVSVQTNWCDEQTLRQHLNRCTPQGDHRWKDIELVSGDAADLHVIFNHHRHERFDPRRTIVFDCETRATRQRFRSTGYSYDQREFLHVHDTERHHTVDKWYVGLSYAELKNPTQFSKSRVMSGIISATGDLPGHRARLAFLPWVDRLPFYEHFGRGDLSHLRSFRGQLPRKEDGLMSYRYHLNAENETETNYFTEKILDAILCEGLCFYAGCPNLGEFLPQEAFVPIAFDDPAQALATIIEQVEGNAWERRLPAIREAKSLVMDVLNPLEIVWRIATGRELPARRIKK